MLNFAVEYMVPACELEEPNPVSVGWCAAAEAHGVFLLVRKQLFATAMERNHHVLIRFLHGNDTIKMDFGHSGPK